MSASTVPAGDYEIVSKAVDDALLTLEDLIGKHIQLEVKNKRLRAELHAKDFDLREHKAHTERVEELLERAVAWTAIGCSDGDSPPAEFDLRVEENQFELLGILRDALDLVRGEES